MDRIFRCVFSYGVFVFPSLITKLWRSSSSFSELATSSITQNRAQWSVWIRFSHSRTFSPPRPWMQQQRAGQGSVSSFEIEISNFLHAVHLNLFFYSLIQVGVGIYLACFLCGRVILGLREEYWKVRDLGLEINTFNLVSLSMISSSCRSAETLARDDEVWVREWRRKMNFSFPRLRLLKKHESSSKKKWSSSFSSLASKLLIEVKWAVMGN